MIIVANRVLRVCASVAAILLITGSAAWILRSVQPIRIRDLEVHTMQSNLERIDREISISSNRENGIQLVRSSSITSLDSEFEELAKNALSFMDPEGIEALLNDVHALGGSGKVGIVHSENLKVEASKLLGERARKRRFDSHQFLLKIDEIDSQSRAEPARTDLWQQREILMKTRSLLLSEYPRDAQRAIALNPNNSRAIYDLCRFMQDKVGSYDRRVIIRNFERVIELRSGTGEKDGDFLNANINLTVLSAEIGNEAKARCYSAQTLEKHLARSKDDYGYMLGFQPDGRINEPEFRIVTNKVNPTRSMEHQDCLKLPVR